jgi:hypothetical protein
MNKFIVLILLSFLISCAGPSRNDINTIRIVDKKDLEKCQAIDAVEGVNDKGLESLAIEQAKEKAFKLDANSIFIQDSVANGASIKITGTAYFCK